MNPEQTWGNVFKDKAMIITLVIMFQFYGIIIWFGWRPSQMAMEAKQVILQAYVSVFTGAIWYWLGSTNGSKMKDLRLAEMEKTSVKSTETKPVIVTQ